MWKQSSLKKHNSGSKNNSFLPFDGFNPFISQNQTAINPFLNQPNNIIQKKEETKAPATHKANAPISDEIRARVQHEPFLRIIYEKTLKSSQLHAQAIEYDKLVQDAETHPLLKDSLCNSLIFIYNVLDKRAKSKMIGLNTNLSKDVGEDDIEEVLGAHFHDPLYQLDLIGISIPPFHKLDEWLKTLQDVAGWRTITDENQLKDEPSISKTKGDGTNSNSKIGNAKAYAQAPLIAELFAKGPNDLQRIDPNDVFQQSLGDCAFMASVAAVARSNPKAIENLIKDNGDGTYDITLYAQGDKLSIVPKVVKVTSHMPVDENGRLAFANAYSSEMELWVMLLEKAFAKLRGSYKNTESLFAVEGGLLALTGKKGKVYELNLMTENKILKVISDALSSKNPVTVQTYSVPANIPYTIFAPHEYAPISVDMTARTLDIQNPHGKNHLYKLPVKDFKKYFGRISVVEHK